MEVDVSKTPNNLECIRCGDCVRVCPQNAIDTSIDFILKKNGEKLS